MSRHLVLVSLVAVLICLTAIAAAAEPSYLSAIGAETRRADIGTVRATAHVTVSDGLEYDVITLFHDHQRAIFHCTYPDRRIALGVDGKYVWSYDGDKEAEGSPVYEDVVLGHQVHAQILFFDALHGPLGDPVEVECGASKCLSLSGPDGRSLHVDRETSRPVGLVYERDDAASIEIGFDRWREVDGISLPFLVTIDDGERVFEYEFESVRFNEGSMNDLRAPMSLLTDEQQLLRLHRNAMDAHLLGDGGMFEDTFASGVTIASRGEVFEPTGADSEAMMASILASRDYVRYDDLIRPVVRVSEDGTLGWVVVQVGAGGVMFDENGAPSEPFEFTSAWISMFEKIEGEWKMVGNVSNFKPDP